MSRKALTNIVIRQQVLLERVKSGMVQDFDKTTAKVDKAIREILAELEVVTMDELSRGDLALLLKDLREAQTTIQLQALQDLTTKLQDVSGVALKFEQTLMAGIASSRDGIYKFIDAAAGYARALEQPIVSGTLMGDFHKNWSSSQTDRIEGVIRDGWAQGKTVGDMMREIRGSKAQGYKDGIVQTSRRESAAMVRTSTQHVAQQARMATWAANGDLVTGYSILATLDSKTTPVCRSLDGKKFEIGKGPVPPIHVSCRSTTLPELGPEFDFLDEGATRSSANGYVDAGQNYYDWLKTQPPSFVKQAIGRDRAKLFLDGNMTATQFSDLNLSKTFEPMSLTEMARVAPQAFEAAGLTRYIDAANLN